MVKIGLKMAELERFEILKTDHLEDFFNRYVTVATVLKVAET